MKICEIVSIVRSIAVNMMKGVTIYSWYDGNLYITVNLPIDINNDAI